MEANRVDSGSGHGEGRRKYRSVTVKRPGDDRKKEGNRGLLASDPSNYLAPLSKETFPGHEPPIV